MIVEKIVNFASINFIHRDCNSKISLMVFPIIDASFKKIFNSYTLKTVHCVCFTRASLTVSKNSDTTLVEYQIENRPDLIEVKLFTGLVLAERIVKLELIVLNSFGNTVNFVATVMDNDLRVYYRNYIDVTISKLLVEDGPLFETDTDFHLVCERVIFL